MRKHLTRNCILMAVLTFVMALALNWYINTTSTVPILDDAPTYADGVYTAGAQGYLSEVSVTVTITGGRVSEVSIDASGETPERGGAAAEALASQLTAAGSTAGVDAVSGSTVTSDAVLAAMDDCLAQAAQ